jgi:Tfp pilus assembly protein PilN
MAMRPANLLPADLAREGGKRLPLPAIAAVGAGTAVGLLLAGGYVTTHGKVTQREQELAAVQAQINAVPKPQPVKVSTISPELAAQKDARQAAVDQALAVRTSWDTVLREVSLVLPDDVWLSTLSAKSGGASADPAAAATASSVNMTGYTYSQEGVARLLTRLGLVPHLDNVQLQSSASALIAGRDVVSFTIAANVVNAGGL